MCSNRQISKINANEKSKVLLRYDEIKIVINLRITQTRSFAHSQYKYERNAEKIDWTIKCLQIK